MSIKKIREEISYLLGMKITIIYQGSRNRKERYDGIIFKTYMNVFSLKLFTGEMKCFSYIDVLTKTIQIYR